MKYYILLLVILLPTIFFGQQQMPDFETTIYLEDTLGNKDSVVIGYDSQAHSGGMIDTIFGEELINTPWDTFDVRIDLNGNHSQVSKKSIIPFSCDSGFPYMKISYLPQIPLTPITVSWKQSDFDTICRGLSHVLYSPAFLQGIPGLGQQYMAKTASYYTSFIGGGPLGISTYIQDNGDTIYLQSIFVVFAKGYPLSTESTAINAATKVYPNPTMAAFRVELPDNVYSQHIAIYDITGREVWQKAINANQIEVPSSTWAKGIYFYRIVLENELVITGKIVRE